MSLSNIFLDSYSIAAFQDIESVKAYIQSFGAWAVAASFLLMILQSLAAPIPAFFVTFANAMIRGWKRGAGDVMHFVGFPEGLIRTNTEMKTWLQAINARRPQANHFSIYDDGIFFGEAFYGIDCAHENLASLDMKLFKHTRSKGIGEKGLRFVIEQAFKHGAKKVFL